MKEIEILARGVCVTDGKLLLCHTKGADNTYLPGGHVEFEESAPDALCREIREELGVEASVSRFLGVIEHVFDQKGKRHCEVNLCFEISIPDLDTSAMPDSREDYIEFRWEPLDTMGDTRLEPGVLCELLPRWLAQGGDCERWGTTYD